MKSIDSLLQLGFQLTEDYYYDEHHHSSVLFNGKVCVILDYALCEPHGVRSFEYSKYCEMQNKYMAASEKLFRFYLEEDRDITSEVKEWLSAEAETYEVEDKGGVFDKAHVDNTPLEKSFEDLFTEAYGQDALQYLQKEYAISLSKGRNAFVDYVIETKSGDYAIEENGEHYHHPQLVNKEVYLRQLEKQNTLCVLGYKTYRFSIQNMMFKEQMVDSIRSYLGVKNAFRNAHIIGGTRAFKLYEHQENILHELQAAREEGIFTSLVVCPTGTGKSQIGIEDIEQLWKEKKIRNALIMVPSKAIRTDWEERIRKIPNEIPITVDLYNKTFLRRKDTAPNYYDYILFDEAHHAQAANCVKTLQYFTPKYLLGLTATSERLDQKRLEDIFGQYKTQFTLKEAIEKGIITDISCYRLESNIDLSMVRYNGKDYNYADLEKTLVVESRNQLIVDTIKKYFEPKEDFYKQGIVFCVNKDHTKRLEKLMNEAGLNARAVYGGNSKNDLYFEEYKEKKVQFLLSCQMISEGWDSPQTEVVVMARPTLSKVLYTQQLGRGVRKYPGKKCLFVIDVVDNYTGKLTPMSLNSLMHIPFYSDFMSVKDTSHNYLEILGLHETEIAMRPVDIFSFEEKYKDYLSPEQAARELFIGTSSLMAWYRKDNSISSLQLPIGSRMVPYFSKEDVEAVSVSHKLGKHDETTILKDFEDFIDENTLTFSFKLVFMLAMFKLADKEGEVDMDDLVEEYRSFYLDRIHRNLPVDRPNCIYNEDFLGNVTGVKNSILSNPFEKFERKRFVYYSKDLKMLSFNPDLWEKMTEEYKERIISKEKRFLEEYYQKSGGM